MKLFLHHFRKRRAELSIWKKRLHKQLHKLTPQLPPHIRCSLHISWGPFFGGAVIANRKMEKFKIVLQIPYDGYLTDDELIILKRYELRKRDLPYFILFHEFSHLQDAFFRLNQGTPKEFIRYLADCQRIVQEAPDYREVLFEEQADQFAYQSILVHCRRTG